MKSLIISIKIYLFFIVLTGIVYPFLVTGLAQLIFPNQANGSIILKNNKAVGSSLIGQNFNSPLYFHSRPSAVLYNPIPSGGSNYSITNPGLIDSVKVRKRQFIIYNELDSFTEIPSEMLFASASGLDPHISPKAAYLQIERIAKYRNFNAAQKQKLQELIKNYTKAPQLLCFGEERVNVLLLNLGIDKIK